MTMELYHRECTGVHHMTRSDKRHSEKSDNAFKMEVPKIKLAANLHIQKCRERSDCKMS